MFDKINTLLNFNQNALNIYSKRQEILASNIANADTPGYHSMDINFSDELKNKIQENNLQKSKMYLKRTAKNHFNINYKNNNTINIVPIEPRNIQKNKNNNTVDMNRERIEFLSNSIKYRSSLVFISYQIKNMISVIRG